jgi:hypothetical protein
MNQSLKLCLITLTFPAGRTSAQISRPAFDVASTKLNTHCDGRPERRRVNPRPHSRRMRRPARSDSYGVRRVWRQRESCPREFQNAGGRRPGMDGFDALRHRREASR